MIIDFSKILIWVWRIFLFAVCLCFFLWLIWQNLIPSGYLKVVKNFCRDYYPQYFLESKHAENISGLYPEGRVGKIEIDEKGRCFQQFFDEPVYFKIKLPRSFERVKLKIFYQNENQRLLQLGLMRKKEEPLNWQFQLQPIENQIFDQLDWYKITQGGITFWQKRKRFNTIQQFVNNVPIDQKTATFYYEFTPEAVKNLAKVVAWNYKTPLQYIDYIITKYQPPKIIDDLKMAEVKFFITPEFFDGHQIEFIFSAPDLIKNQSRVKIYRIEAELDRERLTQENFWAAVQNLINRFVKKIKRD